MCSAIADFSVSPHLMALSVTTGKSVEVARKEHSEAHYRVMASGRKD